MTAVRGGGAEAEEMGEWPALNILLTPVSSAPSLCPRPSLLMGLNPFLTWGGGSRLPRGPGFRTRPAPTPTAQVQPCLQANPYTCEGLSSDLSGFEGGVLGK